MNYCVAEIQELPPMVGVGALHSEPGMTVELLFDSFHDPISAGLRSGTMGQRQMLYRADPYQIDLQLEADWERNLLIVAGQLLDVGRPEMACLDVQVMLSNLRGNVVNTATNQFGEFRGEVENSGNLELSFVGHGGRIVILLRDPLRPSSET